MNNKVALLIIYNYRFDKNIDVLEKLYEGRFDDIYHLMPFYEGNKDNVIPVYDHSYYFQGYIAQGFKSFFKDQYTHYMFVADDMIIHPVINQYNFSSYFKLSSSYTCYIPSMLSMNLCYEQKWPHYLKGYVWNVSQHGVNALQELPPVEIAKKRIQSFGLSVDPLRIVKHLRYVTHYLIYKNYSRALHILFSILTGKIEQKSKINYPLVAGYSDIVIVTKDCIQKFAHYCGVFASTNLFVEIGLPTALALSAKDIRTKTNIIKSDGTEYWEKHEVDAFKAKYNSSIKRLMNNFPETLYVHPIKLSEWDIE